MAGGIKVKLKRTGRLRKPTLDYGQLFHIGTHMVEKQKARWAAGLNANDGTAAPLSKRYMFYKAKVRKTNRPKRDMRLSGLLWNNFSLRKAINGVIRAENTTREARDHATSANAKDQMIGFSGSDLKVIYNESQRAYGSLAKNLWYEVTP